MRTHGGDLRRGAGAARRRDVNIMTRYDTRRGDLGESDAQRIGYGVQEQE